MDEEAVAGAVTVKNGVVARANGLVWRLVVPVVDAALVDGERDEEIDEGLEVDSEARERLRSSGACCSMCRS